jgi:hypothetical protein
VKITAKHAEAERKGSRANVEKGLLFNGIALNTSYVTKGNLEDTIVIEAHFANAGGAFADEAAVSACKATHPFIVCFLV